MHQVRELDKMLGRIRQEGRWLSLGAFTLDPDKARQKMKQFQLEDPHAYAVHLVAAGIAGGASRVEVTNDADDCIVAFDGPPFAPEELRDLFSSLFVRLDTPELRRMRELAIGVNAALGFEPRWVRVDSGGLRLEIQGDDLRISHQVGEPGTRIHVRERTSWRVIRRFMGKLRDVPPEGRLVRDRCCSAPVPVVVNGQTVSQPPAPPAALVVRTLRHAGYPLREGGEVLDSPGPFAAHLQVSASPPPSWVVLNGVRFSLEIPWPHFAATVYCSHLPKNVSQSALSDSPALGELRTVLEQQRRQMWDELAGELVEGYAGEDAVRDLLLGELPHRLEDPRFLKLRLFELSDGNRVSLRPLQKAVERRGFLPSCGRVWGVWPLDGQTVVVARGAAGDCLKQIFPRLESYEPQLQEACQAAARRAAWEALPPRRPALLVGSYLSRIALPQGELGLPGGRVPQETRLTLLRELRPLGSVGWCGGTELPDGILGEVNHDGLLPTPGWDGVLPEQPALQELVSQLQERLPALYTPLLLQQGEDVRRHLLAYLAYLRTRQLECPELEDRPLFRDPQERMPVWSYRQLRAELERRGFVAWTDRRWRVPPLDGARVVRADPEELQLLSRLFAKIENYNVPLAQAEERELHYLRWTEHPVSSEIRLPEADYLARVALLGGLEGEVGVLARLPYGGARAVLFRNRRQLGRELPLRQLSSEEFPLGLCVAANHDGLEGDCRWERPVPGQATAEVLKAVRSALPRLWDAILANLPEDAARLASVRFNALTPGGESLAAAPAFRRLSQKMASLSELDREVERQGFLEFVGDPEAPPVAGMEAVALSVDEVGLLAERYGPARLRNQEDRYLEALCREDFELQQPEGLILDGVVCRRPVDGVLWEGEVGLPSHLAGEAVARLQVLYRSRRLAEWRIPTELGPLEAVVDVAPGGLTMKSDWSDAVEDDRREAVVCSVLEAAEPLARDLLQMADGLAGPARIYLWRRLASGGTAGLAEAPLFPLWGGGAASLQQLRLCPRVEYLKAPPAVPAEPGRSIVLADFPGAETLLGRILGWDRVIHVGPEMEARARAVAFQAVEARDVLRLERAYLARCPLVAPRRGEVGLVRRAEGDSRIEVYHEGRRLEAARVRLSVVLEVVVQDEDLQPRYDWRAVARDRAWEGLLRDLDNLGRKLVLQLVSAPTPELEEYLVDLTQVLVLEGRFPEAVLEQALRSAPLYPAHDDTRLSLAQLQAACQTEGELLHVRAPVAPELVPEGVRLPVLAPGRVPSLRSLAPRNVTSRIEAAQSVLKRPTRELELEHDSGLPRRLLSAPLEGQLQLGGHDDGTSSVLLCWRGRLVEKLSLTESVDFRCIVNDNRLWLESDSRVARDKALDRLLEQLRSWARELVLSVAGDLRLGYLLKLARRADAELRDRIEGLELLRDVRGEFWSLRVFQGRRLEYLDAGWRPHDEAAAQVASSWPGTLFRLSSDELEALAALVPDPVDRTMDAERMLLQRSLRSPRLEDHFPGRTWILRYPFSQGELEGELGLPLEPAERGCILVFSQTWESLDLFPGLLGVAHGSPPRGTEGGEDRSGGVAAEGALRAAHGGFLDALSRTFPPSGAPGFAQARRALLTHVDWRARAEDPGPLWRELRSLRVFPLPEGRYASLDDVFGQLRRGGVVFVRPGRAPDPGEDLVLELAPGELEEHVRELCQGALFHQSEWIALKPPHDALLEAVRGEFLLLGGPSCGLDSETLASLRCGETPERTLCACPAPGEWVLDPRHPAVARLLGNPAEYHPSHLYYVLSSLFSVLNRARADLDDSREREFHRRVLRALLGG